MYVDHLRDVYQEPNTIAYYSHLLDEVFVFPKKMANLGVNAREAKASIFHENTHHVLFKNFSDEEVAETAKLIEKYFPRIKKSIEERYKDRVDERVFNEEIICKLIQNEIENGRYGFLNHVTSFKNKDLTRRIDIIAEHLKDNNYGQKGKLLRSTRFNRRAVGALDETPTTNARGEAGTDSRGRGVLGESEGTRQGNAGEGRNLIDFSISPQEDAQIKSADPITRDDNGNVIPLSERFNPDNDDIRFSIDTDDQGQPYDNGDMPFDEMISKGLADLAQKNKDNVELRVRAMRGIGGNLAKLRQAMSLQRTYDRGMVDSIVRMANMMMGSGIYSGFTPYEVRRLMGMVNRAAGREDITKEADKVVDLMLNHQLKELDGMFKKQLKTKGTKIDNNGVEVQAGLDIAGQRSCIGVEIVVSLQLSLIVILNTIIL